MQTATDKRTRVGVFLYKSERPVTRFHCPQCRNFVAELTGAEVQALTDVVSEPQGVAVRCHGTIEPGRKCHTWYYFYLGGPHGR